jgi:chromosome segregation ATPase
LKHENESLSSAITDLKEEIAVLTDKKNVTDQEQTKLRLTVDSLVCELESVNRTIAGKEDIILKLKADSSSKTEEFKGEIEMKAQQVVSVLEENNSLSTQREELLSAISELKDRVINMTEDLTRVEENLHQKEEELQTKMDKLCLLQTDFDQLSLKYEEAQKAIFEKDKEILALTETLEKTVEREQDAGIWRLKCRELEQQLLNDDEERSKKLMEKQELSDNLVRELDRQKEAYSTLMKKVIVKVNCSIIIKDCFFIIGIVPPDF